MRLPSLLLLILSSSSHATATTTTITSAPTPDTQGGGPGLAWLVTETSTTLSFPLLVEGNDDIQYDSMLLSYYITPQDMKQDGTSQNINILPNQFVKISHSIAGTIVTTPFGVVTCSSCVLTGQQTSQFAIAVDFNTRVVHTYMNGILQNSGYMWLRRWVPSAPPLPLALEDWYVALFPVAYSALPPHPNFPHLSTSGIPIVSFATATVDSTTCAIAFTLPQLASLRILVIPFIPATCDSFQLASVVQGDGRFGVLLLGGRDGILTGSYPSQPLANLYVALFDPFDHVSSAGNTLLEFISGSINTTFWDFSIGSPSVGEVMPTSSFRAPANALVVQTSFVVGVFSNIVLRLNEPSPMDVANDAHDLALYWFQLHSGMNTSLAPQLPLPANVLQVPSHALALGDVLMVLVPMMQTTMDISIMGLPTPFSTIMDVIIVDPPHFGTLDVGNATIPVSADPTAAWIVATATYKITHPENIFHGDSFTYRLHLAPVEPSGRRRHLQQQPPRHLASNHHTPTHHPISTPQPSISTQSPTLYESPIFTVNLFPATLPQPIDTTITSPNGVFPSFVIGGALDSFTFHTLAIDIVDNPKQGSLTLITGNTYQYTPSSVSSFGSIDTMTWKYHGGLNTATISLITMTQNMPATVSRPSNLPSVVSTLIHLPCQTTDTDGDGVHGSIAEGGKPLGLCRLVTPPIWGHIFRYDASLDLRPSSMQTSTMTFTSDNQYMLSMAQPLSGIRPPIPTHITEAYAQPLVLRYSSHGNTSQYDPRCLVACSRWHDPICTSPLCSSSLPAQVSGFQFAQPCIGHEFIEIRLATALIVTSVRIAMTGQGYAALYRISLTSSYSSTDQQVTCGPPVINSTAYDPYIPYGSGMLSIVCPGAPAGQVSPGPAAVDCPSSHMSWWIGWQSPCPSVDTRADIMPTWQGEDHMIVEYPICSTPSMSVDVIRLDFDTRLSIDPITQQCAPFTIESVTAQGLLMDEDNPDADVVSQTGFIYVPDAGITATELLTLEAVECNLFARSPLTSYTFTSQSSSPVPFLILPFVEGPSDIQNATNVWTMVDVECEWSEALNDVMQRTGITSLLVSAYVASTSLVNNVEVQYVSTILPPLDVTGITSNSTIFSLQVLNTIFLSRGSFVVSFNVGFRAADVADQPLLVTYAMERIVYRGCPGASSQTICSMNLAPLGGTCQVSSANSAFLQCECNSYIVPGTSIVDAQNVRVEGDMCEYSSLATCNGRGHPTPTGECSCFQTNLFGGPQCTKRFQPASSLQDVITEVQQTMERVKVAMAPALLPGQSMQVQVSQDLGLVSLVIVGAPRSSVLYSLQVSEEMNIINSCSGNGIPTPNGLCVCNVGYVPSTTCQFDQICREPGDYAGATACEQCPIGYYCPNGIQALPCPDGTFAPRPRSSKCYDNCVDAGYPGMYLNYSDGGVTLECVPCSPGSMCADGISAQPCEKGRFAPEFGMLECIPCTALGTGFYTSLTNATSCEQCPSNTNRYFGSPGESITECVCDEGFWNGLVGDITAPQQTGVPCQRCPANGICTGSRIVSYKNGTNLPLEVINETPVPVVNYWGDPNYPTEFLSCNNPQQCMGNYTCMDGYTGALCAICAPGYQNVGGVCLQCPSNPNSRNAVVVLGVTFTLLFFAIVNRASSEVQALDIALLYTQITNLVQQMNFVWPYPVSLLQWPYALTNFDIDFINTGCLVQWTFTEHFFVQTTFLIMVLAAMLCSNLVWRIYIARKERLAEMQKEKTQAMALRTRKNRAIKAAARTAANRANKAEAVSTSGDPETPNPILARTITADTANTTTSSSERAFIAATYREPLPSNRSLLQRVKEYCSCSIRQLLFRDPSASSRSLRTEGNAASSRPSSRAAGEEDDDMATSIAGAAAPSSTGLLDVNWNEDPRWRAFKDWAKRNIGFPNNRKDLESFSNNQIAIWVNLCRITYNSIVVVCLQTFVCQTLPDGTQVLVAEPTTICYSAQHFVLLVFGALSFCLWGVGIPVTIFALLTYFSKEDLKANDVVLERFGFLYDVYKQDHFRWELFVLFRRFALCVILVSAGSRPEVQALLTMMALIFCLAMHVYNSPYLSSRINVLETVSLTSVNFYCLCGIIFTWVDSETQSGNNSPDSMTFTVALSWILFMGSIATLVCAFWIFAKDLSDFFAVLMAERGLVAASATDDVALIRMVRTHEAGDSEEDTDLAKQWQTVLLGQHGGSFRPRFLSRSTTAESSGSTGSSRQRSRRHSIELFIRSGRPSKEMSLFAKLDKDNSHAISKAELLDYLKHELAMDSDFIRQRVDTLFKQFDMDEGGTIDLQEFKEMMTHSRPNTKDSELKNTLKPKVLVEWANSTKVTPLMVELFFELDEMMRNAIKDSSIVSAYRDNSKSKFYRSIADAFPYLTDWFANAHVDDVIAFRKILKELNEVRDTVGQRGSFSQITVEIDRAPLIFFLADASERERLVFKTVYGSMCEVTGLPMWQRLKGGGGGRGGNKNAKMAADNGISRMPPVVEGEDENGGGEDNVDGRVRATSGLQQFQLNIASMGQGIMSALSPAPLKDVDDAREANDDVPPPPVVGDGHHTDDNGLHQIVDV